MIVDVQFITGVMCGFELYDDHDEGVSSLIVDLLIVRFVFSWGFSDRMV
jgi:hypothetical protein